LLPRDFSRHPHARLADTSLLSHILSLLLSVALPCTQHNKFEDERTLTLAMQPSCREIKAKCSNTAILTQGFGEDEENLKEVGEPS